MNPSHPPQQTERGESSAAASRTIMDPQAFSRLMVEMGVDPTPIPQSTEQQAEELRRNAETVAAAEKERNEMTADALSAFGISFSTVAGNEEDENANNNSTKSNSQESVIFNPRKDFFSDMGCYPELLVEVGKHLRMRDFMILFCISKDFNFALRTHWKAHMLSLAAFMAPESSQVFRFNMYRPLCILDPLSRTIPHRLNEIQVVPGIKWLQMVVHREKASRDILACMARQGHRMPGGMGMSLKKMWLLMDMATNRQRVAFMRSSYWGWEDLYNVQMFVVKLDMRFNDPIDGPASDQMRKLFLGQRGLSPLWRLLKRTGFRSLEDVIKLSVRYNHEVKEKHKFWPIWEIPPHEIGIGHLEGWGKGNTHLYRPDELVVREAIRRRMNMKHHIMMMMLWGYCDPITGENTPPTEKEMYMSDDEERGPPAAWNHYEDPTPEEVEKFEKEKEQAGRDEKDARKAAIAAVEAKKVKEEEAMDVDDMMEERAEADDDFDNDEEMFDENMDM